MKWVDTRYELPAPHRRVLVAIGTFCMDHWIVDGEIRLVTMQEVQYWAPIASTPRRGK